MGLASQPRRRRLRDPGWVGAEASAGTADLFELFGSFLSTWLSSNKRLQPLGHMPAQKSCPPGEGRAGASDQIR